jgi:hypothetical protein
VDMYIFPISSDLIEEMRNNLESCQKENRA